MLNKRILVWLISSLTNSVLHAQQTDSKNDFIVQGKIEHFGNGFLVGTITNPETNTITLDTILITNGIFNHKQTISNKQVIRYSAGNDKFSRYRKVAKDGDSVLVDFADKRLKALEIVAYPGAKINVTGTASSYLDAHSSGTAENLLLSVLNQKRYPLFDQKSNLDYSDKKNIRTVLEKEQILTDSITLIENEFIKHNPYSIVSSYLVLERFEYLNKKNTTQADSLLSLLQPYENDIYYKKMILLQLNRANERSLAVGDIFPGFQSNFVYRDSTFNLDQTKGKYRLIDFWGTWCIPCVKEMPKLKQFYEKHKDSLIVIGIANDTYQNWKAFLDKNTYSWIQLIDQEAIKLSEKLKVEVYPTKYLLDPVGRIILIQKDAEEQLWNKIEKLMNPSAGK